MKWNSRLPSRPRKSRGDALLQLTQSAVVAALYLAVTMASSFMSFSVIQLRPAEALTALPVLFPAAVPGVFIGCLLANLLNPAPLGLVDILGGSIVTLLAAWLSFRLGRPWRRILAGEMEAGRTRMRFPSWRPLILALLPPVLLNALVVGSYLPFLITPGQVTAGLLLAGMSSILVSQALVVYGLGLPLAAALRHTPWARRVYLTEFSKEKKNDR